jgi:hypothetical protein
MDVDDGSHAEYEHWLFEMSMVGWVRNGFVLRTSDRGVSEMAKFYSMNTRHPKEKRRQWGDPAVLRIRVYYNSVKLGISMTSISLLYNNRIEDTNF